MAVVCKEILAVLCFFTVFSSGIAAGRCNNNASCIVLEQCTVLYRILDYDDSMTAVLKKLLCGYNSEQKPMVCCPPELLETTAIVHIDSRFNPVDLLPDSKVCGIHNVLMLGGSITELDEHPWLALLQYDKPTGSGFYCGGVLISSKYVLTAAHCVKGQDLPKSWNLSHVRLGEWNLTSEIDCYFYDKSDCSPAALDMPIEEVIVHENYNLPNDNQQDDIALIRLAREVEFTDFVRPICLPINSEIKNISFDDFIMEGAGWGTTESRIKSDVKLIYSAPVVNRSDCNNTYKRAGRTITENQLCAGGQLEQNCRGDSGGPLMKQVPSWGNWMVIGVASYGPSPCGTPGWPGVYTRVTAYVDWILANIRP